MDTAQQVVAIIGAVRAYKGEITQEMVLKELGFDELDQIELVMLLEDQFRLHIDDEQFNKIETIDQIIAYIHPLI